MDDETLARLIDSGIVLAAMTLGGLSRRLRFLGFITGGFAAASAFTGWTPTLRLVQAFRMGQRQQAAQGIGAPEVGAALGGRYSGKHPVGHGVPSSLPDLPSIDVR
jgi:hypothetical protein